ncbi:hypothetical protein CONPUDRAFT_165633 [Coniophora puteana RWD-64-598 SS2]|uniref:SWI/SNF and RSC complexes subunit Ssr4 N-terminal domain-containing protein n=1 Tax=Coniophora puteana (strain RWD-64-598) TaxID=741705 RepID=A0A5M3MQR3_CONPW|nr:uncharacterized protein CONPUDRAFT_165633 [Coniophora puteana RWD-64-598 SS2]EIW81519.1 hypothetical protein CONPUDRAFT_165633 [Coniophora puteana RWD-64-598 SS2]
MEQPCLRFPENLGMHGNMTVEQAVSMLLRAVQVSQNVPYQWGFIDKPPEGQVLLIFQPNLGQFPIDGIRYQEPENRMSIPVPGGRELEVVEAKYGFVPGGDQTAGRMRRRYRLHKGGHPQLTLVHYSRGPAMPIMPQFASQPVRQYPLRTLTDPPVFVMGDKIGQKVYPPGTAPQPGSHPNSHPHPHTGHPHSHPAAAHPVQGHPGQGHPPGMGGAPGGGGGGGGGGMPPGMGGGGGGMQGGMQGGGGMGPGPGMGGGGGGHGGGPQGPMPPIGMGPQAMLAHQNGNMDALERRQREQQQQQQQARERERSGSMAGRPPPPHMPDDEDAEESEMISTRALAMTRYRRNHELMEAVFKEAAFGDKKPAAPRSPYAQWDHAAIDNKVATLRGEMETLKAQRTARSTEREALAASTARLTMGVVPTVNVSLASDAMVS